MIKLKHVFTLFIATVLTPIVLAQNIDKQATKKIHAKPYKVEKVFKIHKGSLLQNLQKFGHAYHWRLIWDVTNPETNLKGDFEIVDNHTMKSKTALGLLKKITSPFPVNVFAWKGNRVICVTTEHTCDRSQYNV